MRKNSVFLVGSVVGALQFAVVNLMDMKLLGFTLSVCLYMVAKRAAQMFDVEEWD